MSKTMAMILAVALTLTLTPVGVWAQNWYVDAAGGDDSLNPSQVHSGFAVAYRTIGQAVASAASGDVIYVNSGTYGEYVYITKSLTIIGAGNVIVDGNSRYRIGFQTSGAVTVRFENLTFQYCSYGIYLAGNVPWNYTTVDSCRFRKCDQGIGAYNYVQATVKNSVFYDNTHGLNFWNQGAWPYLYLWYCTLANNNYGVNSSACYNYFQYSIFANNGYGYYDGYSPQKVVYCDFWQNTNNNYPALPTGPYYEPNYALDPQFINQAGRNYYLSLTSPLLELRIKDETGRLATIGALKCGAVSNTNFDNWVGWQEGPEGSEGAVGSSPRVALAVGGITLQPGVTEVRLVSPVYDGGNAISRLIRMRFDALEFEKEDPGYKSFIDYDPSTPEREIRYRVGNNPGSLGAWQTTTANASLDVTGRYYQVEFVLRNLE